MDSYELTEWIAFYDAKTERDEAAYEEARRDAEFQRSIEG